MKRHDIELLTNFTVNFDEQNFVARSRAATNSTYKKLAVQWLNQPLCFLSSSVLADSFVLRNRQLLVAANRQFV